MIKRSDLYTRVSLEFSNLEVYRFFKIRLAVNGESFQLLASSKSQFIRNAFAEKMELKSSSLFRFKTALKLQWIWLRSILFNRFHLDCIL
jgi:hypothetical protein